MLIIRSEYGLLRDQQPTLAISDSTSVGVKKFSQKPKGLETCHGLQFDHRLFLLSNKNEASIKVFKAVDFNVNTVLT